VLVLIFSLSGCFSDSSGGDDECLNCDKPPKILGESLTAYGSCGELSAELKQVAIARMEQDLEWKRSYCKHDYSDYDISPAPVDSDGSSEVSYTDTNIQEKGVDESDIIKTDGNHIFAIMDKKVKISRAWPFTNFEKVSEIPFKVSSWSIPF